MQQSASALPPVLKSQDVNRILQKGAAARAVELKELVRICSEEPHRIRLQRSAYTKLIRALGVSKRKMWREAWMLLEKCREFLINDDVIMYNTVLQVFAQASHWLKTMSLLNDMLIYGPFPDIVSFNTALSALKRSRLWRRVLQVLAAIPEANLEANQRTYSIAVAACKENKEKSRELMLDMTRRSMAPGNIVRTAFLAASGDAEWQVCLQQVQELRSGGDIPDAQMLTTAVVSCGKISQWPWAVKLLDEADWRAQRDLGLRSAVEMALLKAGQAQKAEVVRTTRPPAAKAFEGLEVPLTRRAELASGAAKMAAAQVGAWQVAVEVLEGLWQKRRRPNGRLLRDAVELCGEQAWAWAIHLLATATARDLRPSGEIYDALLGVLRLRWRSAVDVLEEMPRRRIAWSVFSCSRCLSACAAGGDRLEAKGAFEVSTWPFALGFLGEAREVGLEVDAAMCNPAIRCLSQWRKAQLLLQRMSLDGPQPTEKTLDSIASVYAKRQWQQALRLFEEALQLRFGVNGVANSILQTLQMQHHWQLAVVVIEHFLKAAPCAWRPSSSFCTNAMLACSKAKCWDRALQLYDLQRRAGLQLDIGCTTMAIRACQLAGLWKQALTFREDAKFRGLVPNVKTWHGLVGLGCWQLSATLLEDELCDSEFRAVAADAVRAGWMESLSRLEDVLPEKELDGSLLLVPNFQSLEIEAAIACRTVAAENEMVSGVMRQWMDMSWPRELAAREWRAGAIGKLFSSRRPVRARGAKRDGR
ncbi:unnamed protein product [Effrenium voratum]|nr:unnamed protein product [Effrenium voratum]